jgi:putative hydrolase of the HAD superfamily
MKLLIWDFDGTLGYRVGGAWSVAMAQVLYQARSDLDIAAADLSPYLTTGFPWHQPEKPHLEIRDAAQWWARLRPVFARAYKACGIEPNLAVRLADEVRGVYTDPSRWQIYSDTLSTLKSLQGQGWDHVLLSNHVPELGEILEHLGLGGCFKAVFNSAETGYEKPHRQAYRLVLDAFPALGSVWMIGDSMCADVQGAERAGIPAILVRKASAEADVQATYQVSDLSGVFAIIH